MSSERPRCRIYVHEIDLMAGFSEDVSNLVDKVVDRFVRLNSLRFESFTEAWQEMEFSQIFNGRKMFRELWEFTECALRVVKEMFLNANEIFEKAALFFLLYGLYFKQPARPRVKILLTSSDYYSVANFVDECKRSEQWDVAYVCAQLITNYAVSYVAIARPVGLEIMSKSDSRTVPPSERNLNLRDVFQLNIDAFQSNLHALATSHVSYCELKRRVEESAKQDRKLTLINQNFPDSVARLAKKLLVVRGEDDETGYLDSLMQHDVKFKVDEEAGASSSSIGERRKKIRELAFERGSATKSGSPLEESTSTFVEVTRGRGQRRTQNRSQRNTQRTSPVKASPKRSTNRGRGRRGQGPSRGRPRRGRPDTLTKEFVEIAKSLEASKIDPHLLDGLLPKKKKVEDVVVPPSDDAKNPRLQIRKEYRERLKMEARRKKKIEAAKWKKEKQQNVQRESAKQVGGRPKSKKDETGNADKPGASHKQNDDPLAGIMEVIEEHPAPKT